MTEAVEYINWSNDEC